MRIEVRNPRETFASLTRRRESPVAFGGQYRFAMPVRLRRASSASRADLEALDLRSPLERSSLPISQIEKISAFSRAVCTLIRALHIFVIPENPSLFLQTKSPILPIM